MLEVENPDAPQFIRIQLSTGHSVTQIGDPPHPVQASLMIASIFGLRFLFSERFVFSATAIMYFVYLCTSDYLRLNNILSCTYKNTTLNLVDYYQKPALFAIFL
jgi:hypothetical protein